MDYHVDRVSWCAPAGRPVSRDSCSSRNQRAAGIVFASVCGALLMLSLASAAATAADVELELPGGDRYRGEATAGVPDGRGILEFADGRTHEGIFVDGRMQGEAEINWPDGARYRGPVKDGEPHGLGTWRNSDGDRYTGEYVNGKRHGWGEYRAADRSRYVGGFEAGRRSGQGTIIEADGALYRGGFRGGRRHGPGVSVSSRGSSLTFERWENGVRQARRDIRETSGCSLREGRQRWMVIDSPCVDGLAHGEGHAVSTDGMLLIEPGRFVLGRFVAGNATALGQPPESDR